MLKQQQKNVKINMLKLTMIVPSLIQEPLATLIQEPLATLITDVIFCVFVCKSTSPILRHE